jgi:hypothetical protein
MDDHTLKPTCIEYPGFDLFSYEILNSMQQADNIYVLSITQLDGLDAGHDQGA